MAHSTSPPAAQLLVIAGFDLEPPVFTLAEALVRAAAEGNENAMRLLLENEAESLSRELYALALQIASRHGHARIILLLLEHGADIDARGIVYGTALQAASGYGHEEIVALLLEKGADVKVYGEMYNPNDPKAPNEPENPDEQGGLAGGDTPLHLAAQEGYDKIVKRLLDHGADPNAPGGVYGPVLDMAARNGHYQVIKLLLEGGADVNLRAGNRTALQLAWLRDDFEIMRLLIDHGANTL